MSKFRKVLVSFVSVLTAVAISVPCFAVDFKYGGLYRWRIQAKDNMMDADSNKDDTSSWIDQRLRMYFEFSGSENLKLVTKWEADTQWGLERSYSGMAGRHGGGDIGADASNLEMKNVYLDFAFPYNIPVRARLGVQEIELLDGWIFSNDASAAVFSTELAPVSVRAGYIAALNQDVINDFNDIDDVFIEAKYTEGPLSLTGVLFYQYGHDSDIGYPNRDGSTLAFVDKEDNNLLDLGLSASYKGDSFAAGLNFVKNFGFYDPAGISGNEDYDGWMIEGNIDYFLAPFTLSFGGLAVSEDFAYPAGRSHYWAEIAGIGTLDDSVGGARQPNWNESEAGGTYGMGGGVLNRGDYDLGDAPRNIWALKIGAAWQVIDTTKITLNYYYLRTYKDVVSDESPKEKGRNYKQTGSSLGHEFDVYVDQQIMDGLDLRLVGAYLISDDAMTKSSDDDNIYEVGAQLLWKF